MSPFDMHERAGQLRLPAARPEESYRLDRARDHIVRTVRWNGTSAKSSVGTDFAGTGEDLASAYDRAWLRLRKRPRGRSSPPIRIVDLFSGCGQMSVGVAEAARALGRQAELRLALDMDEAAVTVCERLFQECEGLSVPVETLLDGGPRSRRSATERDFVKSVGEIDFLVGGPPCQGHSDFNNHTRRHDDRNSLSLKMVRFAELVRPRHIVLENVRGIVHDRGGVFRRVQEHLERLGYRTARALLHAEEHGVPQLRRRMFLVATLEPRADPETALQLPQTERRTFAWACSDLVGSHEDSVDPLDQPPVATERNRKRIQYLFSHDLQELPDAHRPPCHQGGGHSYKSIYGRLWWDRPAQTITTGFRCMGQGRFVHPKRATTITAHEAARLQCIPDFVDFSGLKLTTVAKLIGNAVPPKLLYGIALPLLAATGS